MDFLTVMNKFDKVLFFDIETTPISQDMESLSEIKRNLFCRRASINYKDEYEKDCSEVYQKKASLLTGYSKIVCISLGFYESSDFEDSNNNLRINTIKDEDESKILKKFVNFFNRYFVNSNDFQYLCGYNILNFDVPYIIRKLIQYGMTIPYDMNPLGKKPWENKLLIDLKEVLSFGSYTFKTTTLQETADIMNLETFQDTMGEDVFEKFWVHNDIESIVKHCESDVEVTAEIFRKTLKCFGTV